MRSPFKSLRWRLQAWHGLILLVVIAACCATAYQLAWNYQSRRIDRDLRRFERTLLRGLFDEVREGANIEMIRTPEKLPELLRSGALRVTDDISSVFSGTEPGYAYFAIFDPEGRLLLASDNLPADVVFHPFLRDPDGPPDRFRPQKNRREIIGGPPDGAQLIIGKDIQPEMQELRRLVLSLVFAGLTVWLLGLLGGWWLAGRAMRPIARISDIATRIAADNLAERIDQAGTDDELDALAGILNQTFDRLHAAFERQRQFTADASHELRTPVTILLTETQRILKRPRSSEEYQEALATCRDAAIRMRSLTEALLLLARQEDATTSHEPCDLSVVAAEALKRLAPLAVERSIKLSSTLDPAPCLGDAPALAILFDNLISNAITHHHGEGNVWIETRREPDGTACFHVIDDGLGIAPEDLPQLFERFYRVDKARNARDGHSGLGLAIARSIAESHKGHLSVESQLGQGTTFTFRLPSAV